MTRLEGGEGGGEGTNQQHLLTAFQTIAWSRGNVRRAACAYKRSSGERRAAARNLPSTRGTTLRTIRTKTSIENRSASLYNQELATGRKADAPPC